MNIKSIPVRLFSLLLLVLALGACSTMQSIRVFELNVKVVDEKGQPIASAMVESSSHGEKVATGKDGLATLKFGAVGVHTITVMAKGRSPAAITINMPLDVGETKTVRMVPGSGASMGVAMATQMMGQRLYPMLFQSLFAAHGYRIDVSNYQPGQWTEWELYSGHGDEPLKLRKALLKRLDSGAQWWQVETIDADDEQPDMILEVLFSDDLQSVRRMRQKMGDGEVSEVPVTEGWYTAPQRLTAESLEGAVDKRGVTVKVPAGSFQTDRLRFANMGGVALHIWRNTKVPGGVVKSETVIDAETNNQSLLSDYGSGAKTKLGSY